jgi:hypothetical protein
VKQIGKKGNLREFGLSGTRAGKKKVKLSLKTGRIMVMLLSGTQAGRKNWKGDGTMEKRKACGFHGTKTVKRKVKATI